MDSGCKFTPEHEPRLLSDPNKVKVAEYFLLWCVKTTVGMRYGSTVHPGHLRYRQTYLPKVKVLADGDTEGVQIP